MTNHDSLNYQHIAPELRVFHGSTSLDALKRELERAGCQRAVVVCGNTISRSQALGLLRQALCPLLAAVASTAKANSPVAGVEETARLVQGVQGDALIAVGGGSAAVTARATAVLLGEKKPLSQLCTRRLPDGKFDSPRLNAAKLPIFVVPTTPSTAFAKAGAAVHDDAGQRLAHFDPKTRARGIFVHPEFVRTAPLDLVREAALNAFANAVEALESPKCDPVSEAFLLQALRLMQRGLPQLANAQGTGVREVLVVAALLCGRGTEQGGAGLASVLAHAIGHRAHVANGIVNAIVLPHTVRYNEPATATRRGAILEGLGASPTADASATVAAFLGQLGTPTHLREIGVGQHDLPDIARAAMGDWFISRTPRAVPDDAALLGVLRTAL